MAYYNAVLSAAFLAVFFTSVSAQTGCTSTLLGLTPCLNYVSGNSSSPSSSCCSQLSSVVATRPECLCLLLNNTASSYGYNVNQTLALALPSVCNVQTPPLSKCNVAIAPSTSPVTQQSPPADSSTITQQIPPADSSTTKPENSIPSGSKSVPSVNGAHVDGTNIKTPLLLLLFVATYALSLARF